jgi:peptidoglycan L-alanyl-D-glutamate endopeptidase CwlK
VPSTSLRDLDQRLAEAYVEGKAEYEADNPGRVILVTCTRRSVEEQQRLYAQGRTTPGQVVTQIDGLTKKSKHNLEPARAIDIAISVGGKVSWDPDEYKRAAVYLKARGASWGGDWLTFRDYPHFEV